MILSPKEISDLTGYKRPGKQIEALQKMGIKFWVRLDGKPVVHESALSRSPSEATYRPNWG